MDRENVQKIKEYLINRVHKYKNQLQKFKNWV